MWASGTTTGLDLSGIWRVAVDQANPNRLLAAGRGRLSALTLDPGDPFGKGIPSTTEDLVPSLGGSGAGDGNGGGIQDSGQPNVASLPLLAGGGVLSNIRGTIEERARTKHPVLNRDSERSA